MYYFGIYLLFFRITIRITPMKIITYKNITVLTFPTWFAYAHSFCTINYTFSYIIFVFTIWFAIIIDIARFEFTVISRVSEMATTFYIFFISKTFCFLVNFLQFNGHLTLSQVGWRQWCPPHPRWHSQIEVLFLLILHFP